MSTLGVDTHLKEGLGWEPVGFDGDISTRHGKRADGKTTAKLRRFLRDLIPGH